MAEQQFKRNVAFKLRIGSILSGKPIVDADRLRFLEIEEKQIARVNVIANIIDKYVQDSDEKKYATITLDDATGNIKVKSFGDDIHKFLDLNQGDTILVIGMVRMWNNEIYITPEIIKKKEPSFLLVRKLELEADMPKSLDKTKLTELKDKLTNMIKEAEKDSGIDVEKIILELKEPPEIINKEIKKLLEDGLIYEPRPSRLRWLG
ncbi:OB-fold nucleic acid binding domain-containing protein [Candidatus Pacearchaeota archaeon]|nr:OB-fold nucleic acid binding domain-containing protein [Candidatus Pacearchaeota archaeon]